MSREYSVSKSESTSTYRQLPLRMIIINEPQELTFKFSCSIVTNLQISYQFQRCGNILDRAITHKASATLYGEVGDNGKG